MSVETTTIPTSQSELAVAPFISVLAGWLVVAVYVVWCMLAALCAVAQPDSADTAAAKPNLGAQNLFQHPAKKAFLQVFCWLC